MPFAVMVINDIALTYKIMHLLAHKSARAHTFYNAFTEEAS